MKPTKHYKIYAPAIIITMLGFILAYQFVQPAPPGQFTLATGYPDNAYHQFGLKYQDG